MCQAANSLSTSDDSPLPVTLSDQRLVFEPYVHDLKPPPEDSRKESVHSNGSMSDHAHSPDGSPVASPRRDKYRIPVKAWDQQGLHSDTDSASCSSKSHESSPSGSPQGAVRRHLITSQSLDELKEEDLIAAAAAAAFNGKEKKRTKRSGGRSENPTGIQGRMMDNISGQLVGEDLIQCLHRLVKNLPSSNLRTCAVLMHHLQRVADLSDVNQMSASNLGIVFGPTLLRPLEGSASLASFVNTLYQTRAIELLITHAHLIFGLSEDFQVAPSQTPIETLDQALSDVILPESSTSIIQCDNENKSSTSSRCRSTDPKDNASSTNQNLRSSKTRSIDPYHSVASRSNRSPKSFKTKSIDRVNNVTVTSTNETRSVDTMSDIHRSTRLQLTSAVGILL